MEVAEVATAAAEEGTTVVVGTIAADMEEGVETMEAASNNIAAAEEADPVAGDRVVAIPPREGIKVEAVRMRLKQQCPRL